MTVPSAWLHPAKAERATRRWLPAGHPAKHSRSVGRLLQRAAVWKETRSNTLSFALCPSPTGSYYPNLGSLCTYHRSPVSYRTGPGSYFLLLSIPCLHPLCWELPAGFCMLEMPWACFPWGLLLFHSIQLSSRRLWWKLLFPCAGRWLQEHTRLLVNTWEGPSVKLGLGKCIQKQCLNESTWERLSSKKLEAQAISWAPSWPTTS